MNERKETGWEKWGEEGIKEGLIKGDAVRGEERGTRWEKERATDKGRKEGTLLLHPTTGSKPDQIMQHDKKFNYIQTVLILCLCMHAKSHASRVRLTRFPLRKYFLTHFFVRLLSFSDWFRSWMSNGRDCSIAATARAGECGNQKKVEISCRKQGVKLSWFCALKGSAAVASIHSRLLSCLWSERRWGKTSTKVG